MGQLLHEETSGKVIGAAIEVHKVLGCGFLEAVYEEALAREMRLRGIQFDRQKPLEVTYKGEPIKEYICDFLVEGKILVELKAMRRLSEVEEAQILNYLKASSVRVGLLFNFG
jgi:GxxExxY protein